MEIGKMKVGEAMTLLRPIANNYGLKLHKAHDFKLARILLANLYCHEIFLDF